MNNCLITEFKKCTKCNETKHVSEFIKSARCLTGVTNRCKLCQLQMGRKSRMKNLEYYRERDLYWNSKRDLKKINNRPKTITQKKQWYEANKDRILQKKKQAYNNRRDIIEKRIARKLLRKQILIRRRIHQRISMGVRRYLRYGKQSKSWNSLLGYNADDLKKHLESQFKNGMSWDEFLKGNIHIDHILPVSFFYFDNYDSPEFKQCWSLENLQPLWKQDNLKKRDYLPDGTRASQVKRKI